MGTKRLGMHYTLDFFKSDRFLKLMVELRVCTHACTGLLLSFGPNYWPLFLQYSLFEKKFENIFELPIV